MDDDEVLMQQLRLALAAAEVSAERRRAAEGAFVWRTIDEELLALSRDSLLEASTLVRAAAGDESLRVLSFEGGGMTLEVELAAGQLTAQVLPSQTCRVTVQSPTAPPRTVDVDDSGFFELVNVPDGPLRFRVEVGDQVLVSAWLS